MYDDFVAVLEQSSGEQLQWHSLVSPSDNHMSIPSNTINEALRFVFELIRLKPDSDIAQQGVNAIKTYFNHLSNEVYGYTISPQPSINGLGYQVLFTEKNNQKAIEVFKANVKLFPGSPNAYDSLSEAYYQNSQYKQAIQAIEQALKLTSPEITRDLTFYKRRKASIEKAMSAKGES
jgi:tetratricopeptide (TPR) repeat protein